MNTLSRSRLTIDLAALKQNYKTLCAKRPNASTAAIVKADAYGLGMKHVAKTLFDAGCRQFFTAYTFEAVELRQHIPDQNVEIYVFNGPATDETDTYKTNHLTPVLNTQQQIMSWQNTNLPCAIHIDTGMNRLGLSHQEVSALLANPKKYEALNVKYLISHFACSSEPEAEKNQIQYKDFCDITEKMTNLFPNAKKSISASGGLFLANDLEENLTRPGVSLYGVSPQDQPLEGLRPVTKLESPVVQTRIIQPNETVGYGATYVAKATQKIATLSIGYADGYPRSLSSNAKVMINGEIFPVVGIISMDLITVDITNAISEIKVGDIAECFGQNISIESLAQSAGTIPYELLVSIGNRVERIYCD